MASVTIDPPPSNGAATAEPLPSTPSGSGGGADSLSLPAGPPPSATRSMSIVISPRHRPTAAPSGGNNDADKLAKLDSLTLLAGSAAPPPAAPAEEAEPRPVFAKTLVSEVSNEEAIRLLQRMDEQSSLFREFSFSDLAYLAQVLTILKFAPGDVIIEAGEEASFVGIVLQGQLEVSFGATKKPIPEFQLLGELSFFEGGTRTAAVSAQTDAVVGMITHNELIQLAEYAPTIRLKLMVMFALEGIKKMRLFGSGSSGSAKADASASAAAEGGDSSEARDEAARKAAEDAANAPYGKSANKRSSSSSSSSSSGTVSAAVASPIPSAIGGGAVTEGRASGGALSERTSPSAAPGASSSGTASGSSNAAAGGAGHERSRSSTGLKRVASLVRNSLSLLPSGAAPSASDKDALAATQTSAQSRNVEALFRIRMKASEKAQQDKIENALLKRKKAEHKAYTTTVIADSFKRELDKKQEFIEELYQENIDLREYKAWAQRKHIADAKFLKEKLENYAELSAASQAETAKRILLEKQLAVQIASHDSAASSQKAAHAAEVAALESELRRASGRIETAEKAVASLTESLRIARNRHVFDELRLKDATKQTEIVRVQQASLANEQVALAQRAMYSAQDELSAVKRAARDAEGQVASLTAWKDAAAEAALQAQMLHARMHRRLVEAVERAAAVAKEAEQYRVVIKHLLASWLAKHVRRRRALRALYREQVDLTKKLSNEVAQRAPALSPSQAPAQSQAAKRREGLPHPAAAATTLALKALAKGMDSGTDGEDASEAGGIGFDDDEDGDDAGELVSGGGGGAMVPQQHKRGQSRLLGGFFSATGGGGMHSSNSTGAPKSWLSQAKPEAVFHRLTDLVALARSLVEDLAAQRTYWRRTADSFFARSIELKQKVLELEQRGGAPGGNARGDAVASFSPEASTAAAASVHPASESKESDCKDGAAPDQVSQHFLLVAGSATAAKGPEGEVQAQAHAQLATERLHGLHPCKHRRSCTVREEPHSHGHSGGDAKDLREKLALYKRKTKEQREANSALAAHAHALEERLRRFQEWQHALFPAPVLQQGQAALFAPMSPSPLVPLPPVAGASQPNSGSFRLNSAAAIMSPQHQQQQAPVTPVHHRRGSGAYGSVASPFPSPSLMSPDAGGMANIDTPTITIVHPSGAFKPQHSGRTPNPPTTPSTHVGAAGTAGPAFQIRHGSGATVQPSPPQLQQAQTQMRSPASFVIAHNGSGSGMQSQHQAPAAAAGVGAGFGHRHSGGGGSGGANGIAPQPLLVFPPSSSSSTSHHAHTHSWTSGLASGRGGALAHLQQASLSARAHQY